MVISLVLKSLSLTGLPGSIESLTTKESKAIQSLLILPLLEFPQGNTEERQLALATAKQQSIKELFEKKPSSINSKQESSFLMKTDQSQALGMGA